MTESLKANEQAPYYDSDDEQERLLRVLEGALLLMLRAVNALVVHALQLEAEDFALDANTIRRVMQVAAARVVGIDTTTQVAVAATIREGHARGYTNWQIAHGVTNAGYGGIDGLFKQTWQHRAAAVARTELQEANRQSALERYLASGLVDRVQIIDGCNWDSACCERNGTTVPIEQAPGLNHPNCTLVLVPVLRHGVAEPPPAPQAVQAPLL